MSEELNGLASVLKGLPYRVLQGISDFASPRGAREEEKARFDREYAKFETMAFTLFTAIFQVCPRYNAPTSITITGRPRLR